MSQSMIFSGSTDSKGQARKTGTQRFLEQLNTHLWCFIPPSLVIITHQPTTNPIMSLCMCERMWLARMNLQCVSVYPGARVLMRLNKLSYLPPIRALTSTRNVPFVILGMCPVLQALSPRPSHLLAYLIPVCTKQLVTKVTRSQDKGKPCSVFEHIPG